MHNNDASDIKDICTYSQSSGHIPVLSLSLITKCKLSCILRFLPKNNKILIIKTGYQLTHTNEWTPITYGILFPVLSSGFCWRFSQHIVQRYVQDNENQHFLMCSFVKSSYYCIHVQCLVQQLNLLKYPILCHKTWVSHSEKKASHQVMGIKVFIIRLYSCVLWHKNAFQLHPTEV